jgi:glycosyltransferase involved in cell wall biosynthesis
MRRVNPYFLTSKWEDGSVSRLLRRNGFEFMPTSFGYLGRARPTWTLINLLQMPRLFWVVISSYFKKRCEKVLILNIQSFVNALPPILLLRYLSNAKLVFYLGDIPTNYRPHRLLARLINRLADQLIANSQAVKRGLQAIGIDEHRIQVIYNGVNTQAFSQALPRDFRRMYDWPADCFLVGYIGQFSANKGVMDFVRAAEIVFRGNPSCRFILVGKLEGGDSYQQKIADYLDAHRLNNCIVFSGWTDEVEAIYRALDVVVVPSRYDDPAPNVNLEAMASGVPVIATRAGGSPELVLDGVTGFLVDKASPEQIAEHLLRLARDVEMRARLGQAGKDRVQRMFDIRKNAALVEEVLING